MTESTENAETTADNIEEPDYKAMYEAKAKELEKAVAESRKWEKRSKANFDKAQKLDELQGDAASIEERIAALEADKKRLEDEKARAALVDKVAKATGVPMSIIAALSGNTEEALTAQAMEIVETYKSTGAPTLPEAGMFPSSTETAEGAKSTAQLFADAINNR